MCVVCVCVFVCGVCLFGVCVCAFVSVCVMVFRQHRPKLLSMFGRRGTEGKGDAKIDNEDVYLTRIMTFMTKCLGLVE